jgi:hypothetical protein
MRLVSDVDESPAADGRSFIFPALPCACPRKMDDQFPKSVVDLYNVARASVCGEPVCPIALHSITHHSLGG